MDKLESLIERAMPLGSCAMTNQNIKAKRAWLKREIEKLYANVVPTTTTAGPILSTTVGPSLTK